MENDRHEILLDLLADWEIARSNGVSPNVLDFCKNHPELLSRFQEEIKKLEKTNWMVDSVQSDSESTPHPKNKPELESIALSDSIVSPEELLIRIRRLNLLNGKEISDISDSLHTKSSEEITEDLVAAGKLTKYQSKAILGVNHFPLVIDRYTIIDFIGSGGMGIVFKARHQKMNRVVALKTMPAFQQESEIRKKRFRREINSLCQLQHPNIICAIDALEWSENLYLVMEYASGKDLNAIVRDQGPLPTESAVAVIFEIAKALEFAHKKGIIHRDVKPANILLADDGTVKLLDLGLARIKSERESLTQSGAIVGTPDFLPPEHFDNSDVTAAADLYSLGCTLYFLLTGRAPYESKQIINTIVAHKTGQIPTLPQYVEHANLVEPILFTLLAKSPSDRPASMASLCESIKNTGLIDNQNIIDVDTLATTNLQIASSAAPFFHSQPLPVATVSAVVKPRKEQVASVRYVAFASLIILAMVTLIALFVFFRKTEAESIDFKIAKWVLSYEDCSIEFETSIGLQTTSNLDTLPDENFTITGIQLVAPTDPPDFLAFSKLTKLKWLSLSSFSKDEIRYVNLSRIKRIKKLYLENCDINGLAAIEISSMNNLQELHLPFSVFVENAVERLDLSRLKGLTKLDLDSTAIKTAEFNAMRLPTSLQELDISSNDVDDHTMETITTLTNLQQLVLYQTSITNKSIELLSKLKNLKGLDLSFTDVTGSGLRQLSGSFNLQELSVEGIGLDDDSISHLLVLARLSSLDISSNPISDSGFGKLSTMSNLRELFIAELNRVSDKAIDQLAEALPDCDFYE